MRTDHLPPFVRCNVNPPHFSGGVRGKFVERLAEGANVVILDPDVAEVFPTSKSVNDALRALASIIRSTPARRKRGRRSA